MDFQVWLPWSDYFGEIYCFSLLEHYNTFNRRIWRYWTCKRKYICHSV